MDPGILGKVGILEKVEGPEGCKGLDGVEEDDGVPWTAMWHSGEWEDLPSSCIAK